MTKKHLLYIGAGIFFIFYAVLVCMGHPIWSTMAFKRYGLQLFTIYVKEAGTAAIINYTLIITGFVCIAKGVVGDLVSDISFVVYFGLMALCAGVTFVSYFIDMLKFHQLNTWIGWVDIFLQTFPVVIFGAMAGIILLKDAFGGLYFAPAAIQLVRLVLALIFSGFIQLAMMNIVIELLLIVGLFTLGKAATNN